MERGTTTDLLYVNRFHFMRAKGHLFVNFNENDTPRIRELDNIISTHVYTYSKQVEDEDFIIPTKVTPSGLQ